MSKKSLTKKIESKLDTLQALLDQAEEVRVIDSNDPDTWDSDALYNLVENCQEILKLLEDQKGQKLDEFGQPMILAEGLCSLVDNYHSEEETEEYE